MTLRKSSLDKPQPATDSSRSFLTIIFISCSPGQAACQNLWLTPWGFRFHPAGAVTKINDLIFVVLDEWQQLGPGWLTLSAVCHSWRSPLPISQIALILRSLPPLSQTSAQSLWSKVVASSGPAAPFTSHRGENVQSSEQMCWENSSHSPARSWWPGTVLGSWERGKRSREGIGCRLSSWHLLWSLSLPAAINQTVWLFSVAAT